MSLVKKIFPVIEMTCAACAVSVESIVAGQAGVTTASVNFADQSLLVDYDSDTISPLAIRQAVQSIGYDLILSKDNASEKQEELQQAHFRQLRIDTIGAGILAFPVFIIGMFFMHMPAGNWIMMALSTPVVFFFGRRFFIHAWKQTRHRKANMDTLVALSTGIAFVFSAFNTVYPQFWESRGLEPHVYFEAAAVIIFFILLGKMLEERAKANTSSAIKKLMGLQPNTVTRIRPDGQLEEAPIGQVQAGDRLLVKPGAKIPVDGQVKNGESYVDESMLSGEPLAVLKNAGAPVFAGTINQKGSFEFVAEKIGAETLLAQIIQAVQAAQGSKAPVQRLVDKIAGIFVPVVLLISVVTFVVWMVLGGENALTHALLTSITVLVIACPCALGLATPTAIIAGVGRGAELGILVKDAESLERAHQVTTVVFDKTGTLTAGKPQLTDQHWWTDRPADFEKIIYALESRSEHPLASALAEAFQTSADTTIKVSEFESITGAGVSARIDQDKFHIGNRTLMERQAVQVPEPAIQLASEWQKAARTVVFFAKEKKLLALLSIQDPLKSSSREAIRALQQAGIELHMLSGDNPDTVAAVGKELGISNSKGALLPADKSAFIKTLQAQGQVVAMVGDGINDAEAMAQADVSIAMGKGSDIALETAKMALLSSDLMLLPKALRLSKKTVATIRQNLFWAFIYNLIGIPVAAGILYPFTGFLLNPMLAGAAMALSSVSVVGNSLLLRKIKF